MGLKNYAYINPKMLVWARCETPFGTISEVCNILKNIKEDTLKKLEEGTSYPSITEAKALAKLYDIPFAALYLSDLPQRSINVYTDRRTLSGTSAMPLSYELWKEIRYLIACRENSLELFDEISVLPILPFLMKNESIEKIAKTIRANFNIKTPFATKAAYKNNSFNYFRTIMENHGILVLQISGISLKEIRGISLSYESLPIIAVNKSDSDNAKVFTLFHELSHLIRRTSALCMVDFNESSDEEEKLCDKIAAEVLLPRNEFLGFSLIRNHKGNIWDKNDIFIIADKFGVSSLVVLRRLYELRIISFDYYFDKYNEYFSDFEKNRERIRKIRADKEFRLPYYIKYLSTTGKLYPTIVLSAYSEGKISFGEVCSTLNIKSQHIHNIEQAVMY